MRNHHLIPRELICLDAGISISPNGRAFQGKASHQSLDYLAILCSLLGINPKTATYGTIKTAVHRWFKRRTGETVYGPPPDIDALSARVEDIAEQMKSLSMNTIGLDPETDKIRKSLGISDETWLKHNKTT